MKHTLLYTAVFVLLSCSQTPTPVAIMSTAPATTTAPDKKNKITPKRELGSLWTEESSWNEVFSAPGRRPGDLVTIQVEDTLKQKISRRLDALLALGGSAPEPKKIETPPPTPPPGAVDPKAAAAAAAAPKVAEKPKEEKDKDQIKTIRGTIEKIVGKDLYQIRAAENLKVGDEEPLVAIEGIVREKDIKDDKIESNVIFNMRLRVAIEDPALDKESL